ncbi:MAG: hypothetical protein EZS28_044537 [Streblomastix strix]|uniref:Uncharacterized protein n=1 Tax=Streblomastix strix TaxID=222440 RepID=A0A5J4TN26_9EUKA|nr:MAG: hypothetical protein EZS28_044537 [Streblomastix strix]
MRTCLPSASFHLIDPSVLYGIFSLFLFHLGLGYIFWVGQRFLVNYLAISFALIEDAKIQCCQTEREFQERCIKVVRSLSGIPSFASSVVAECRIEYTDAPTIFSCLNSFVSCRLMYFVVVDLLKPLYHYKKSVPFGNCFFSLSIHSYIDSFRLSFSLLVSYISYVSIEFASFGYNLSDT